MKRQKKRRLLKFFLYCLVFCNAFAIEEYLGNTVISIICCFVGLVLIDECVN